MKKLIPKDFLSRSGVWVGGEGGCFPPSPTSGKSLEDTELLVLISLESKPSITKIQVQNAAYTGLWPFIQDYLCEIVWNIFGAAFGAAYFLQKRRDVRTSIPYRKILGIDIVKPIY